MVKKLKYIIVVLLLISCDTKDKHQLEEENIYRIISHIINTKSKKYLPPVAFPPPPKENKKNEFTLKDSLDLYKNFYDQYQRKKNFAVNENLQPLILANFKGCEYINDSSLTNFIFKNTSTSLELEKIFVRNKDSVILYKDQFIELENKGLNDRFNALFTFSNIAFDHEYKRALVKVEVSFGRLNGLSTLIYLEKKHHHWEIKCEKGLSIS